MTEAKEIREVVTPVSKLGLSFDSLYKEAQHIQSQCEDYFVTNASSKNIRFNGDSGNLVFLPDGSSSPVRSPISKFAMGQLCAKVGVPSRYIEKCLESGLTDLAADNINSWLDDYGRSLFIRQYDNTIRGILSDRYMTLDTPDILSILSDVIDPRQYSTKGFFLSPERFHARIVQNTMMKVAGEDLFAGIQVDSSDVGRSTVSVKFFIFKQVCTNGLCISKAGGILFEQRHVGINIDDFRSGFQKSMSRIPDLIEYSQDMIQACMKDNLPILDEKRLEDFAESLRTSTRLSRDSVGKVIDLMQEKYSTTRWGLVNSLTEVAQDFTLERRVELEKIAGDILSKVA